MSSLIKYIRPMETSPPSSEKQRLTVCTVDCKTSLDTLRSDLERTLQQHGYNPQSTQQDSTQYPEMLLIYSGTAHGALRNDVDDSDGDFDETTQGEQEDYHILRIALNSTYPEADIIQHIIEEVLEESLGEAAGQIEPEEQDGAIEYTVVAPPDETESERRYVSPGLTQMALLHRLRHIIG